MTRTTRLRLMILQFLQIRFTEALTFISHTSERAISLAPLAHNRAD
jgi:hypothetical protein